MDTIFGDHFQPLKRGEYVIKEMMGAKQHHTNNNSLSKMKKTISWPPFLVSSVFETWSSEEYDRTKIQVDYASLLIKQEPYNTCLVLQEHYDMFGPCYEGQFDIELDFGIDDNKYIDRSSELAGVSISPLEPTISVSGSVSVPVQIQHSDQIFKMAPVRRTKSYNSGLSNFNGTI
jgi:hypothetical protein